VPADCALTIDRRNVPPETAAEFHEALTAHLRAAVPDDIGLEFRFTDRPTPFLEAWDTAPDATIVEALASASGGEVRPFTAATEASYFAADAPTVVFGPGVLADEGEPSHTLRGSTCGSQTSARQRERSRRRWSSWSGEGDLGPASWSRSRHPVAIVGAQRTITDCRYLTF